MREIGLVFEGKLCFDFSEESFFVCKALFLRCT
jgi:hypothetical protein